MAFYSIAYTCIDILGTYTTYYMFKIFYEGKEKNKLWEISSYIAYHIIITIFYLVIRIPIVMLIGNLIMLYLITLNYDASIKERAISVVLTYFIQTLAETLVVVLSGVNSIVTEQNELLSLLTHINVRIVGFILVLLISKMPKNRTANKGEHIGSFIILTIPLTAMYLFILFQPNAVGRQQLVFSIIVLLCMNLTAFYLYNSFLIKESQRRKFLEQENKNYLIQYELIRGYSQELSKLRHDMKNYAGFIEYMLENGKKEEVIKYVNGDLQESIKDRDIVDSGNITVDSILNSKILEAGLSGVKIRINMAIPEALKVDSFDLTVIFSNLLNHAIAETKKNSIDNKIIDVILSYNRGLFFIQIIHFEEDEIEIIKKKYSPNRRNGYIIDFLNTGEVRKSIKTFGGDFSFNVTDKKVEAFAILHIPLDVWIKTNKK